MTKTRLEAFSDGVIAILITIMVLELKPPHGTTWELIRPILPTLLSYVISFIIIAIYWGNHHHLLHTVTHINSQIIWANMNLLFWISLIPFATAWMGENNFSSGTVAIYAGLHTLCGLAYYILLQSIMRTIPEHSQLRDILIKQSRKGLMSFGLFAVAIPAAFYYPVISECIFGLVMILWWIPDKNIERSVKEE